MKEKNLTKSGQLPSLNFAVNTARVKEHFWLDYKALQAYEPPWGRRGRIRPQHPLACRKRRLNGAACLPWAATRVA